MHPVDYDNMLNAIEAIRPVEYIMYKGYKIKSCPLVKKGKVYLLDLKKFQDAIDNDDLLNYWLFG